MSKEIERKFRVKGDFTSLVAKKTRLIQGYLLAAPEKSVRIRIKADKAFLTIKGKAEKGGIERYEWEKEIPVAEARELLDLCEGSLIEKIRYEIPAGRHTWEVDVFEGENKGLVLAEIELNHPEEDFEKPAWLGEEVTGDPRFYNAFLCQDPYKNWHLKT